jgi:DNA topoisomerase VI subunit B
VPPWGLSEAPPEIARDFVAFDDHLGKDAKPGVTVYRFANRIPLLFEGGGDVATQVSKRRINWGAYKMRHNLDKIGVFVSLVSTKVPYP